MNGQKSAEKLRLILWRQWKKPRTRASHMNAAITVKWLNQRGLTSLLAEHQRLACLA
jgi:hypothetical protein